MVTVGSTARVMAVPRDFVERVGGDRGQVEIVALRSILFAIGISIRAILDLTLVSGNTEVDRGQGTRHIERKGRIGTGLKESRTRTWGA